MVPYWAWQGPHSEGTKGKDANCQETEGFKSGKERTQDRTETKSGIRATDNSGGTDVGDSQQIVATKGAPNLKTAEPTGATNLINIKPIAHAERPIGASAGRILVNIDGEPKGTS